MCLLIFDKEYKINTTNKSIVCYKQVNYSSIGVYSIIYPKRYKRLIRNSNVYIRAYNDYNSIFYNGSFSKYKVKNGYHSYNCKNIFSNSVFIIPKNTKYISGHQDCGINNEPIDTRVSETIIYIGRQYSIITNIILWFYRIKDKIWK